jgi:hypothetical protein
MSPSIVADNKLTSVTLHKKDNTIFTLAVDAQHPSPFVMARTKVVISVLKRSRLIKPMMRFCAIVRTVPTNHFVMEHTKNSRMQPWVKWQNKVGFIG